MTVNVIELSIKYNSYIITLLKRNKLCILLKNLNYN